MKLKLLILIASLISVFGFFLSPSAAKTAIPEDGKSFPQNDYVNTKLWWRDDTHSECSLKDFSGVYMYKGLKTFDTQEACQSIVPPVVSNPPPTTPAKDVVISWPKRIILQIQEFFASIIARFLPSLVNSRQESPTKEQPVYNCGGFMGTQCPTGFKCKILGGDAGTCVK